MDSNFSGSNRDTLRQAGETRINYYIGSFDQNLWLLHPGVIKLGQGCGKFFTTSAFVMSCLSVCEAPQVGYKLSLIRHPVGPNLPGDARPEDLLGSPASNTEKTFDRLPVDPRPGKTINFGHNRL